MDLGNSGFGRPLAHDERGRHLRGVSKSKEAQTFVISFFLLPYSVTKEEVIPGAPF